MAWTIIASKKKIISGYKTAHLRADINGFTHADQSIDFKIEWSANGITNWQFNMGCFIPYSPEATVLEVETSIKPNGYFRVSVNIIDPYGTIGFSNFIWELLT
jgi:hypothetical protein